jgi:hypothetical protein
MVEPLKAPGETSSIPAAGRFSKQIKRLLGPFQATRLLELYRYARSLPFGSWPRQNGEVDTIRPLAVLNAPLYSVTSSSICWGGKRGQND